MKKWVTLVLCGLAIALGIVGCGLKGQEAQTSLTEDSVPGPAYEAVPVEATTTQGNKVVFPGGEISWVDAVISFTPGDPAASRSRDPNAALGRPDYQGTDDAADEATAFAGGGRG